MTIMKCVVIFIAWIHLFLPSFSDPNICKNEFISITVSTELQADVLLPCIFDPTLLGSDKTADIAAVWSHRNITVENIVEIPLQGGVKFWKNRGGRIDAFPKLSTSGNFSILLHKVQQSDLGLYLCELHNGINCRLAYRELHLSQNISEGSPTWWIIAGAASVLSCLFVSTGCCIHRRCRTRTSHETGDGYALNNNPIYDSASQPT